VAKQIILDANILIRAVLGSKVSQLLQDYAHEVSFITVDEALEDAKTYIPQVMQHHDANQESIAAALTKLEILMRFIHLIPVSSLSQTEQEARDRLKQRDEDDWPFLALALILNCPIWTEDTDFFGSGVATWTSDRIQLFLDS